MNARAVKPPACPTNCSTCSNGTCTKCKSGYYLSGGKCIVETPDSCGTNSYWSETETMPGSGSHCIACGYKYGPCLQCNATQCTKCSNGYLMVNNSCQHYQSACTQLGYPEYITASSQNAIGGAISTWVYARNCTNPSTKVFPINDSLWGACIKCKSQSCGTGQWKFDGKCRDCDPNALTCSGSTMTCKSGYVLKGGYVCAKCDSSCKTCYDVGPVYCSSCPSGKYLSGGRCI